MKKIKLLATLIFILIYGTACGSPLDVNIVEEKGTDKTVTEFKEESNLPEEEKPIEKLEPEKKEEEKTQSVVNPEPNEKPVQEKQEQKATEVVEIAVEDKNEPDNNEPPEVNWDFIKDPVYHLSSSSNSQADYIDVQFYGTAEVDEDKYRNYNINKSILEESGETMVFIPKVYGGNFKIHRIEYEPEMQGFYIRDKVMDIELKQDDIVLVKTIIPESAPQLLFSYEKEGEYLVQSIPTVSGMDGTLILNKGFHLISND